MKTLAAFFVALAILVVVVVLMFLISGAIALKLPKIQAEETYRCEKGVLFQHHTLAQADLYWWGPFPLYRTTRDETVGAWVPTDKGCAE